MASEVTYLGRLTYEDAEGMEAEIEQVAAVASVSSKKVVKHRMSVATSETAIDLGGMTTPGWAMFKNLDATNYLELKVAASGAIFAKLKAGEICGPIRLGSGAQVPVAIANTGACAMEYLLCDT